MAGCPEIFGTSLFFRSGIFSQKYTEIRPELPPDQKEQADHNSYCQANSMSTIALELSFTNRTSLPASSKFVCRGKIGPGLKYSDDFVQIDKTQIKGTCSCSPRFGDFSSHQRILDQMKKKWWIEEKQKDNPIANIGLENWLPDRKLISASPSAHEGETRLGANPMPAVWQSSARFLLYSAQQGTAIFVLARNHL